jgi:hypothetical protein
MQLGIDRPEDYMGRCDECGRLVPQEDLIYKPEKDLLHCIDCVADDLAKVS